jgi:general L-amino acid transport system permease protein
MVGITLFSAAYLAENVRGGLQAIPKGQFEAAQALGLSGYKTMVLIVLPQALRAVIPILVGQFITLFKDTSLVAIVGLFDLLGIADTVLAQPAFIGLQPEVYVFISAIYFVFSYGMSYVSQRLEKSLGVGER